MRADASEKGKENEYEREVYLKEEDLPNGNGNGAAKDTDDFDGSFVLVSVEPDLSRQCADDDHHDPASPDANDLIEAESGVPAIATLESSDDAVNDVVSLPSDADSETNSATNTALDLSSCNVEDVIRETDTRESIEEAVDCDHFCSAPEIENDLESDSPANGVVSLPLADLPSCVVKDTTEPNEKSIGDHDSCPAEIENDVETDSPANGVVSLPADLPSCAMDAKESSEKGISDHDSCHEIENDLKIVSPANGVVSLPADLPSCDEDKMDTKESNEKSIGDHDSCPTQIKKVLETESPDNGVVSLPLADLPSCDVEDMKESNGKSIVDHDSCPVEIESDPVANCHDNDAVSEPETNGGSEHKMSVAVGDHHVGTTNSGSEDKVSTPDSPGIANGDLERAGDHHVNDAGSEPETNGGSEYEVTAAATDSSGIASKDQQCDGDHRVGPINGGSEDKVSTADSPGIANGDVECTRDHHVNGGSDHEVSGAATDTSGIASEDQQCDGDHRVGLINGGSEHKESTADSPGIANGDLECAGDQVELDINASTDDDKLEIAVEDSDDKPSSDTPDDEDGLSAVESSSVDVERGESESRQEVGGSNEDPSSSEGQNVAVEMVKNPFYYLIRVPKFDDETFRERIKLAEIQVQERTKTRDTIRAKIQLERATTKEYADKVQAAVAEERAARDAFRSKRQEMDSLQSVINKLKNALSVEDIDARICNMEHMIQHETLPLKEEKQFIREIKQLKQQREQICSNLGKQDEVQQALDQKDEIEDRMKGLKKELDSLRVDVTKAERVTQAAKKELQKENEKLNELVYQFKVADDVRQEAYAHFQSSRRQQKDKNKHFSKYRDDVNAAKKLAASGDREQLQHLCVDQVERIMTLWNEDDDFRREYVEYNTRSTLWRLRTLDGRALGPDEEPPVIPSAVNNNRVAKEHRLEKSTPIAPEPEKEKEIAPVKAEKPAEKSVTKVATANKLDEVEESRVRKEKEELARKAEEQRKKEEEEAAEAEAAKLKEMWRLEEKAKAKEAIERKKRNAGKAEARAAIRAQKEAEEKEKVREKRARKKERKKQAKRAANDGENDDAVSVPASNESADETVAVKAAEIATAATAKRAIVRRANVRTKAIMPPPLRNKGKKRMFQPWMLFLALPLLLVCFIFLLPKLRLLF